MSKNDVTYLAAVSVLAAVMLVLLLWPGEVGHGATVDMWGATPESGGVPRPIDSMRFRELIRQRQLSDQEAAFYRVLDSESMPER